MGSATRALVCEWISDCPHKVLRDLGWFIEITFIERQKAQRHKGKDKKFTAENAESAETLKKKSPSGGWGCFQYPVSKTLSVSLEKAIRLS